jgi:hypothetical protein
MQNTLLRCVLPIGVADAARSRAEAEGKTLADVTVELLDAYGKQPKRARTRKAATKGAGHVQRGS